MSDFGGPKSQPRYSHQTAEYAHGHYDFRSRMARSWEDYASEKIEAFGLPARRYFRYSRTVTSKTPKPKRHHFIPQMMLRHFANDEGRLWFWRRDFPAGEARNTSTANLFVEKDLYTYTRGDGSKDTALEEFFAQMEGAGAVFINSLARIVRAGEVPVLTDTSWDFWNRFYFYHLKRTPGAIAAYREAFKFGPMLDAAVVEVKRELREAGGDDSDPDLDGIMLRNAEVIAQGVPPSPELLEQLKGMGLAVFRIQAKRKSFIIGDVPGAEAPFLQSNGMKSPPMLFLPLTWDIAVALIGGGRRVEVSTVDRDQVRTMNIATAARATTIAGRSEELVNSLATGVPYSGVVIDREMGGDAAA